ncbi:hypothetical protein C8A05DRAFT_20575, partial [Staphylotrichum tortipilum]
VSTVARKDFLSKYLGGKPFQAPCTLSFNGCSLMTRNALVDTGADGYLFVNVTFGRKLVRLLGCERFSDFDPHTIGGFDEDARQIIDTVVKAHLTVQNRTVRDEWLIVIDSPHDVIIGRTWFERYDVLVDCYRRRLLFPLEWEPDANWRKDLTIRLTGEDDQPPDPKIMEDIHRREALMCDDGVNST